MTDKTELIEFMTWLQTKWSRQIDIPFIEEAADRWLELHPVPSPSGLSAEEIEDHFKNWFLKYMHSKDFDGFKRNYPTLLRAIVRSHSEYKSLSQSQEGEIQEYGDIEYNKALSERDSKIQELQSEIDDNRKVIAANGMTIGELRKEVERLEKYIADHFNHVA